MWLEVICIRVSISWGKKYNNIVEVTLVTQPVQLKVNINRDFSSLYPIISVLDSQKKAE